MAALAASAAREGYEIVAAAGGDGTAGAVAAGLYEADTGASLAVLPIGTANDFARHLGIPRDPRDALRAALASADASRVRAVDLIRCVSPGEPDRPRWVLNAAVGGLAGRIGDALGPERRRRWGRLAYLRAGLEELRRFEALPVRLTVDQRQFELEALMVVVANGRYAGGGIPFAPGGDPFDGRLEVVAILKTPGVLIPATVLRVVGGRHIGSGNVLALAGRHVEFHADADFWTNLDGETWMAGSARFDVVPEALSVLLP
jgi:YegS/Rv2252/BmrU family lipid kinase